MKYFGLAVAVLLFGLIFREVHDIGRGDEAAKRCLRLIMSELNGLGLGVFYRTLRARAYCWWMILCGCAQVARGYCYFGLARYYLLLALFQERRCRPALYFACLFHRFKDLIPQPPPVGGPPPNVNASDRHGLFKVKTANYFVCHNILSCF